MTDEKKPDGGLAGWIEVLEDDQSGDSELLCLLLELRRHRENGSQARAEAFRALEQENILLKQGCENNPLVHEMIDWRERAEAAEAKLAELEKQPAIAWLNTREGDPTWPRVFVTEEKAAANREWVTLAPMVKTQPLFTRPAPAVSLAELVPDQWTLAQALKFVDTYAPPSEEEAALFAANAFRDTILRNIKESK